MEITRADLDAYLQTKGSDDIVGIPDSPTACLIAEATAFKYGMDKNDLNVPPGNHEVTHYIDGAWRNQEWISVEPTVTAIARKFDTIPLSYVTRHELEEYIPELFGGE